eukprot:CAMPEP_0182423034 /NCGR_PEP_ID=MMETSP1167-20130531/8918_1 /TAXON_ID=2988 /ORGANISM="Mallomonas Sp, Strain CCMP3275" /LENGTH=536 /DNA_ID=CAMNT_0024601619 /DNA_START=70 /DNA_END=1677 /DNA_ORIENTATION=+
MAAASSPLQIISIESVDGCNGFTLNEENLSLIIDKIPPKTKVALLSMVGAFRTGKSFMLNLFLRYLRNGSVSDSSESWMIAEGDSISEGNANEWVRVSKSGETSASSSDSSNEAELHTQSSFKWRGGQERQTTGVWMWSEPFIRHVEGYGGEVAILLMDTQGMFDNETTMTLTAQIFGLSTLVSSYQIYNVDKRIQEDNLQHLALFSEYGRMALKGEEPDLNKAKDKDDKVEGDKEKEKDEVEKEIEGEREKEGEKKKKGEREKEEKEVKPFQRLDFLVRDWQNFEVDIDEGLGKDEEEQNQNYAKLRDEMDSYLNKVLAERTAEDLQSTREQIHRCFSDVNCFLMPHPGNPVTKLTYKGEIAKIDITFRSLVNKYVRKVFDESIRPKIINHREITGIELKTFFQEYVKLFTDDKKNFPKAMTMLEATSEANNRNAMELALLGYKETINNLIGNGKSFVKDAILQSAHTRQLEASLHLFSSIATMGSLSAILSYKHKLQTEIEEQYEKIRDMNASRNPFRDIELYVIPLLIAAISW